MPPSEDEDLDYWLATQTLPKEEAAPQGVWQRAEQLLKSQQRPADPMPLRNGAGMSWAAALAAIASKDPGGVIAADAANRRADMDAWYRRNGPDAQFDRQRQLAGVLSQEEAGRRAAESQAFERDRLTANDAFNQHRLTANDAASSEQQALENRRNAARDAEQIRQFGVTQSGMDRRNTEDNQRALEVAQANAAVRTEAQQALAATRADAAAARKEAALQREYNDFRNKNGKLFDLAQAARGIEDVWARHPVDDRPGAGVFDGSDSSWLHPFGAGRSDDDMAVRANFKALQEYLQNKVTGASAPRDQAARIAAIAGAQSGATEQQAGVSLDIIRRNIREQLRAAGSGREAAARKVLADMGGLDQWVYGKDPTPEQLDAEVPQVPEAPRAPTPPAAGDRLPVTTQRRADVPKVNDYLRKLAEDDQDLGVTYGR